MAGPIRSARLRVRIDGESVDVPGDIGTDRPRAVQAPAHTHDTTGEIALEGRAVDSITLGQFFTVWGVRLDGSCLGSVCGGVRVRVVDGISLRVIHAACVWAPRATSWCPLAPDHRVQPLIGAGLAAHPSGTVRP